MRLLTIFAAALPLLTAASAAASADPASTFAELQLLNYDERVEAYGALPYPRQRAYWVGKVQAFKTEHLDSLTPEQKSALDHALRIFKDVENLRDEEPVMSQDAVAAFGGVKAHELLASLYSEGEMGGDVDRVEGEEEDVDAAAPPPCNCSVGSAVTCPGFPHNNPCIPNAEACEHLAAGCGAGLVWACDGRCQV
ncbi:hypothetical protein FQN54_008826 [Arachnomyces sp. PD_36]|nr:hypothetical protein FQN54_008826 [Arachnomyces sp. PD_36]